MVKNLADLSTIANGISTVMSWFWGIFSAFFGIITSNSYILWPVIFAIVAGAVLFLTKFLRRLGLRGRR